MPNTSDAVPLISKQHSNYRAIISALPALHCNRVARLLSTSQYLISSRSPKAQAPAEEAKIMSQVSLVAGKYTNDQPTNIFCTNPYGIPS